jgi:hypothetical protein
MRFFAYCGRNIEIPTRCETRTLCGGCKNRRVCRLDTELLTMLVGAAGTWLEPYIIAGYVKGRADALRRGAGLP